jgi:hypothetical protein
MSGPKFIQGFRRPPAGPLGFQLASVIAGGPALLIATALFTTYKSGFAIAMYIAIWGAISFVSAALMHDHTGKDVSMEYDEV